jgi:hypothetical protein
MASQTQTHPLNYSKPPKKSNKGGGGGGSTSGLVSAFSSSASIKNNASQKTEFGPPKPNRCYKIGGHIFMQSFYCKGKLEVWIVEFEVDEEGKKSGWKVIALSSSEYSIIKDRIREIVEAITPSLAGIPEKFSSHKISDTLSVEIEYQVNSSTDYIARLVRSEFQGDLVFISMSRDEFSIEFEKALKSFYFVFSKFPVMYEKGEITRKVLTKCSMEMIRLIRDKYPEADRFDSGAFENPRFRDAFFDSYNEMMNVYITSIVGEISLDAHDVEACLFSTAYQCMNQLDLLCYAMNIFESNSDPDAQAEKKRYFIKKKNQHNRTRILSIGDKYEDKIAYVQPIPSTAAAATEAEMASYEDEDAAAVAVAMVALGTRAEQEIIMQQQQQQQQ